MTDRAGRMRMLAVAAIAVATATLSACASDPPSPAEQRRERVQARIEDTFSKTQAACIMKTIDAKTIAALDKRSTLPTDGSLELYSNALVACVGAG